MSKSSGNGAFAAAEDFLVKRDGEGELLPMEAQAGEFGTVLVVPMTYGDAEDMSAKRRQYGDIKAPEVAKIINRHVLQPDFGDLTGTDIRDNFKAMAIGALLEAIMSASGIQAKVTAKAGGDVSIELDTEGNA